jgi:flagellar basal-body rod protein FlgB
MNQITDDAIVRALGRQMNMAVARQAVASGNLANIDTPGYRTRDVVFDEVLSTELSRSSGDSGLEKVAARVVEAKGLSARRDGNNVQLDRELLQMGRASADFAEAQTALNAKFRLVRYAISEGR